MKMLFLTSYDILFFITSNATVTNINRGALTKILYQNYKLLYRKKYKKRKVKKTKTLVSN